MLCVINCKKINKLISNQQCNRHLYFPGQHCSFQGFFKTFPYLWSFSRLFKALKIYTLNSRTFHIFPGSVRTLINTRLLVHSCWTEKIFHILVFAKICNHIQTHMDPYSKSADSAKLSPTRQCIFLTSNIDYSLNFKPTFHPTIKLTHRQLKIQTTVSRQSTSSQLSTTNSKWRQESTFKMNLTHHCSISSQYLQFLR